MIITTSRCSAPKLLPGAGNASAARRSVRCCHIWILGTPRRHQPTRRQRLLSEGVRFATSAQREPRHVAGVGVSECPNSDNINNSSLQMNGVVERGKGVWRSAECATSLLFFNWVASAQVSNHSLCPQRGIISTCVAWQTGSAQLDDTPQCLFLNKYKPVHSIIFDFVQSIHDDMMKYLFYGKFVCHICIMSCMRRYETLFLINWGSFYFFHNLKAEIIKTGTWHMFQFDSKIPFTFWALKKHSFCVRIDLNER